MRTRIIGPTDGTVAAERRLAAAMLNMEHGALAYGPDLARRPEPHAPWPTIPLAPVTARGHAAVAHYRPAVGLVYYTAGEAFEVRAFVERLAALLGAAPEDHLLAPRAVAATPATVLRRRGRVAGGTVVAGPRRCFRKPAPGGRGAALPARLLLFTPEADPEPPPHWSARAAFTWVFAPVAAALAAPAGVDSMAAFNAIVASLVYDSALLTRRARRAASAPADGPLGAADDAPGAASEPRRLTLDDFDLPRPPAFLAPAGLGPPGGALVVTPAPGPAGPPGGAGALGAPGTLAYVGQHLCLCAEAGAGRWAAFAALPAVPWDPAGVVVRGPGEFQCVACDAPVGGDAVLVRNPCAPQAGQHSSWFYVAPPEGDPLLGPGGRGLALLLCLPCWGALESPECLTRHMRALVWRTAVPLTQAEACAACPGYEGLAPLLAGAVRPVRGAPGAFAVETPAGGPGRGATVVLAGDKLGRYPALANSAVAALRLPVVAELRVAEARPRGP